MINAGCSVPMASVLWDWAGFDGLRVAHELIGDSVHRLARFQSCKTTVDGLEWSVLRLCDQNFRVRVPIEAEFEQAIAPLRSRFKIWAKPCTQMGVVNLPDALGVAVLPQLAVTKPIYRLETLAPNCAIPARLNGKALLVWRHTLNDIPIWELHTATADLDAIQTTVHQATQALSVPASR